MIARQELLSALGVQYQASSYRWRWCLSICATLCHALFIATLCGASASSAWAVIQVQDDTGQTITMVAPARRIISLAPHITELLFAAGAGPYVVGAAAYSDFPPAAKEIPRIGDARGLDLERIAALRPHLVVAWQSGNPAWSIQKLESFGVPIFVSEPRRIEDVAANIDRLARLAGSFEVARRTTAAFRRRYSHLRSRYSQRAPVRIFYQVWHRPLMTVNGAHLISDVIELCGGVNIFADLPMLTAKIDIEAVVHANPTAIIAAGTIDSGTLDSWQQWPHMNAVKEKNLFLIPYNLIARHTPRILDGAERLCAALEQVRNQR